MGTTGSDAGQDRVDTAECRVKLAGFNDLVVDCQVGGHIKTLQMLGLEIALQSDTARTRFDDRSRLVGWKRRERVARRRLFGTASRLVLTALLSTLNGNSLVGRFCSFRRPRTFLHRGLAFLLTRRIFDGC